VVVPVREPVLVGCSHGTDEPLGRAVVAGILEGVRRRRPGLDVRAAFVDVQEPAVGDVVAAVSAEGREAVVVPLLLSAGYHVHVDIAAAVAGRPAVAAGALGPDARLVACLVDRLREAGTLPGDAVVLAAAGSSDARATRAVEVTLGRLRQAWPHGPVGVAYGSAASPRVPEAVAQARAEGAARVVVSAYLLAPGWFHDRLAEAGADVVTAPLAPDIRVLDVVLDRYDAAAWALGDRRGPHLGGLPGPHDRSRLTSEGLG
jgi:sirohydrochlorin ferrochelatase